MSGLFSKPQAAPVAAAPEVKPPAPMPDPDAQAAREARRKSQMDIMGRAGRSSTILTAPDARGGTAPYSASRLGADA